jgi:hypothetical protein
LPDFLPVAVFCDSPVSTVTESALQLPVSLKEVAYNIRQVGRQGMNGVTEVTLYTQQTEAGRNDVK